MAASEPPPRAALERAVADLSPDALASQRWFGAKGRPIADISLVDAAWLPADGAGAAMALLIPGVAFADGGAHRYLLPLVVAARAAGGELAVGLPDGRILREPRDGEGAWRRLAWLATHRRPMATLRGAAFDGEPIPPTTADARPTASASERRLTGEQSNTSAVIDERLVYKSFRRLEAGPHPDLEIGAFLARVGFPHVPRLIGGLLYRPPDGQPAAAGMLQRFVVSRGDAWTTTLAGLRALVAGRAGERPAADDAELIGRITGELHRALAADPGAPGFEVGEATPAERAGWQVAAERQLDDALAIAPAGDRAAIAALAPAIRNAFGALRAGPPQRVQRIHGDYHLGQLLRTDDGLRVIDFEGEPLRPLAERRAPASALRDVAGMLRSFDYAAATVERDAGADRLAGWRREARARFLAAYSAAAEAPDRRVLRAFELEKACYELRYEARNRPDWAWLPLAGLRRLMAEAAP